MNNINLKNMKTEIEKGLGKAVDTINDIRDRTVSEISVAVATGKQKLEDYKVVSATIVIIKKAIETIDQNKVAISEEASNTIGCITDILEDLIAELRKDSTDGVRIVESYRRKLNEFNIPKNVEDVYRKYITVAIKTAADACDSAKILLVSAGF